MQNPKVVIVVPTIRETSIIRFLEEWKKEFSSYSNLAIFIIEDNNTKSFNLKTSLQIKHFSWEDIETELGEKSWIIPRRTDCVRSYGYYKAYQEGADILITLDDDCYPTSSEPYLIKKFIKNLSKNVSVDWFNTLNARMEGEEGFYPRGFPYKERNREVVLCHGLWNNIPDFDGQTQIKNIELRMKTVIAEASVVPKNILYPMCGMNVAVKREVIPIFYFLLMGKNKSDERWGIDRFGDIWAGIFSKKIIDHLNKAVVTGEPVIHHDRASDPEKNILLEKEGVSLNDELYENVQKITLSSSSYKECYIELAEKLSMKHPYFKKLKEAMIIWANLF